MKKIDKLFKLLDNQNIRYALFERECGISNGYLKNTNKRGADLSLKILDKIQERQPIIYNKLVADEDVMLVQEPVISYLDKRRNQKNKSDPYLVPLIPVKAQAGYVRAMDQEIYIDTLEKYALPPGVNPQGAIWRYWEIEGDSMEPVFHSNDIILTSQVPQMDWENLRNFYLYVIVTPEKVLFKRIYAKNDLEWVLISENEINYPQQLLPVEFIKEVWVYRRSIVNKAPPSKMFEIKV